MVEDKFREDAEAHWKWLESLLHKVYVDAMIHGFGHGYEIGFKDGRGQTVLYEELERLNQKEH